MSECNDSPMSVLWIFGSSNSGGIRRGGEARAPTERRFFFFFDIPVPQIQEEFVEEVRQGPQVHVQRWIDKFFFCVFFFLFLKV